MHCRTDAAAVLQRRFNTTLFNILLTVKFLAQHVSPSVDAVVIFTESRLYCSSPAKPAKKVQLSVIGSRSRTSLMWVNRLLEVNQPGQLSLSSSPGLINE